ncbi:MAG: hypothetical protein GY794_03500, partial [bacterium]|nr:hypothetical protein [bacterium]
MKRLKRHVVRLRVRLAGMSTAARVTAGILTSGILGGAVWLLWAIVTPEPMVTLCNELNDAARDQAITALEREGIGYRRTVSGLQVSPSRLSDARKVLRTQPTGSKSSSSGLSGLASSSSMWRSSAENRRLWQAGVMAELGRMITEMDPVASASVLFEPGCNGGLGVKARVSRAAVKVTLVKGRRMSPALIVAIGELVSGSVAVEIGDVRVIDQTGRSYRPSSDVRAFARRNAFESHYSDKIISALRYIPGISVDVKIVTVRSESKKSVGENMRVWVSVPRSYLKSVLSEGGQSAASRQLASVKDAARAVLSPGGNHDINVVLHGPANTANSDGAKTSAGIGGGMFLVAMLAAVLVGGLGFWLLTRYRGLVVLKPRSVALPTSDESSDALDYEMLGRFSSVCSDDTGDGFDGEHPQTLALML